MDFFHSFPHIYHLFMCLTVSIEECDDGYNMVIIIITCLFKSLSCVNERHELIFRRTQCER